MRKTLQVLSGSQFASNTGIAIGGWLILVAGAIILQPILIFATFFSEDMAYVTLSGWNRANGESNVIVASFRTLLVAECFVNALLFCGSIFVLVLFFRKRDSFPKVFSIFFLAKLGIFAVDAAIIQIFFKTVADTDAPLQEIARQIIFCSIWVAYVNGSSRVNNTFVNEYKPDFLDKPGRVDQRL